MFIYNVTFGVDQEIEAEWLAWMKDHHVPEVLKTGYFTSNKIYRVITGEEGGAASFAVQYFTDSIGNIQQYLDKEAPRLRADVDRKFGQKATAYRTVLREV